MSDMKYKQDVKANFSRIAVALCLTPDQCCSSFHYADSSSSQNQSVFQCCIKKCCSRIDDLNRAAVRKLTPSVINLMQKDVTQTVSNYPSPEYYWRLKPREITKRQVLQRSGTRHRPCKPSSNPIHFSQKLADCTPSKRCRRSTLPQLRAPFHWQEKALQLPNDRANLKQLRRYPRPRGRVSLALQELNYQC